MHGPYPGELRTRVINFVEGRGSRREAAEQFDVSVSSAIRWVQRFQVKTEFRTHAQWREYLAIGEALRGRSSPSSACKRDLTLDEIVSALHKRQIPGSRSALSRFFARHGITIKKKVCGRQSGSAPTSPARADARFASKAFLTRPTSYLSTRRQSPLTCCGFNGSNPRGERLVSDAPMGHWETVAIPRWAAANRRRGFDADQRSHEWRGLPGLHRAMFGPNAQAQGHCGGETTSRSTRSMVWRRQSRLLVQASATCRRILRTLTP